MKISIIVASFNSAKTIRDTFESILSQSHQDYEVVVKDGGSTDGTVEIIEEYEKKFGGRLKWVSEPDRGIYDAMNKGIEMSTGEVVGILNSDDFYYDSTVLSTIADSFSCQEIDAVCGNLFFVNAENVKKVTRIWKGSPYVPFSTGWHPAHPTFYVKRDCYLKYGLYDTSFDVSADFELMLRFLEKEKLTISYIDRSFVYMREGGESTGNLKKIILGNKNIMRAFRKNEIPVSCLYPVRRLLPKLSDKLKHIIS